MKYLILSFLFLSHMARADGFGVTNRDTQIHVLGSSWATLVGSFALQKTTDLPKWKCALVSLIFINLAGALKEVTLDAHPSGGDMASNLVGSTFGGALSLEF